MVEFELRENVRNWNERWKRKFSRGKAFSGSQGNGYIVERIELGDDRVYFLKCLKNQKSKDSRWRMAREVIAYEALNFPGIPKLIESNAHFYRENEYQLYLVTEYIEGAHLTEALNASEAIICIKRLCEIVSYMHNKDVIHRDIKPNNIILQNNNWNEPYLVDFGISYIETNDEGNASISQRLGNKFLYLPEFAPDSNFKRDARSDLTLLVGIFFYLLTGVEPRSLSDQDGNMPHQKYKATLLEKHGKTLDVTALMCFFDQGFSYIIDDRFQSIEQIIQGVDQMDKTQGNSNIINVSTKKNEIKEILNNPKRESITNIMKKLEEVINLISRIMDVVSGGFGSQFYLYQTNLQRDPSRLEISNNLSFVDKLDQSRESRSNYRAYLKGCELILEANDKILYRFNARDTIEKHLDELSSALEEYMIEELYKTIKKD